VQVEHEGAAVTGRQDQPEVHARADRDQSKAQRGSVLSSYTHAPIAGGPLVVQQDRFNGRIEHPCPNLRRIRAPTEEGEMRSERTGRDSLKHMHVQGKAHGGGLRTALPADEEVHCTHRAGHGPAEDMHQGLLRVTLPDGREHAASLVWSTAASPWEDEILRRAT
jgi:hypothetical protein